MIEPYIPPNSQQLCTLETPKIMLALQGASGTGKTFSGLTDTNIIAGDVDNLLAAHLHRKDIHRIPFFDPEWCRANIKEPNGKSLDIKMKYPQRDAIRIWLDTEGQKLQRGQIFFLDGWSSVQDYFDLQTKLEPVFNAQGAVDARVFWALKQDYSREILDSLKRMRCHVIVSFHEQDQRDDTGNKTGKTIPLMQGNFNPKLGKSFTDWFQCVADSKVDPIDKKKIIGTDYWWKTKSTSEVNLKSRLTNLPMLIEPNFKNLVELYFNQNPKHLKQQT